MKPKQPLPAWLVNRRLFLGLGLASLTGCASRLTRGQTPEAVDLDGKSEGPPLVGDDTRPFGLNPVSLEAIALVKNLSDTGSDPPPSQLRQELIMEMQSHEVRNCDAILASPTTSMVMLKAVLPPGVQKGETIDIAVSCPMGSQTTSLRGGWVMPTRLRQVAVLDGQLRKGGIDALAQGDVIVDAVFDGSEDKINEVRGFILSGGVSNISRDLGLAIRKENATARLSSVIASAINLRFSIFDHGVKQGVATAKRDDHLDLTIPPVYRRNLSHYLRVVRNIPLRENPVQRVDRLAILEKKLLEPATCAAAGIQLEAIGKEAIPTLHKGLTSPDQEVRFYAAQALAYLDDPQAADVLRGVAEGNPAFRWYVFTALAAMNHVSAYNALSEMLNSSSIETRYGAFQAMRTRSPDDPATKGQVLGKAFRYHVISSTAEPVVHFTRRNRPEVVLLNSEQPLRVTEPILAGKKFVVKSISTDQVRVSCFAPGQEDQQEVCASTLDPVIRAMVKMGANYADIVEAVNECKRCGALASRIAIEAMPTKGRQLFKDEESKDEETPTSNPVPDGLPSAGGDTAANSGLAPVGLASQRK